MAYNEMHRVPDRPLESNEKKYFPAMSHEEEKKILMEFVKDHYDAFIEYIDNYDSTLFWDFADIERVAFRTHKDGVV